MLHAYSDKGRFYSNMWISYECQVPLQAVIIVKADF